MNNGKRSINISLGSGSPNLNSRSNPFARPTRPSTTTALGFGDDEGDDDDEDKGNDSIGSTGPPKRKQIKLEHGPGDTEDQEEDAFSKLSAAKPSASVSSASRPSALPGKKSVFGDEDDDEEEDAFSRLGSKKGTQMLVINVQCSISGDHLLKKYITLYYIISCRYRGDYKPSGRR